MRQGNLLVWLQENRDMWIEALRIYLGIALILKGLQFILNKELTMEIVRDVGIPFFELFFTHLVVLVHIAGGFLLTLGLVTRVAAFIQIPILAGAIFFVHRGQGLFGKSENLPFVILVLFLLIVFVGYGSGRLSIDYMIQQRKWRSS